MVPTSTSFAPARFMMSGMRNAPPISISSPRETGTSLRFARVSRTSSTAAALLLTTIAASAEVSRRSRGSTCRCRSPRRPVSRSNSRLLGAAGHRRHRRDGLLRQRRAPQVGVQHRSREVEQGDQRRRDDATDAGRDGRIELLPADGAASGDGRASLVESAARRLEHERAAVVVNEGRDTVLGEQPIHGGKLGGSGYACHVQGDPGMRRRAGGGIVLDPSPPLNRRLRIRESKPRGRPMEIRSTVVRKFPCRLGSRGFPLARE